MLYGGTSHTNNAIPLYHYLKTNPYSSNLFLNDSAEETRTLQRSVQVPTIYIPSKYFVTKNHKRKWEIIKPYVVLQLSARFYSFVTSNVDDGSNSTKIWIKRSCARHLKWLCSCDLENVYFGINSLAQRFCLQKFY